MLMGSAAAARAWPRPSASPLGCCPNPRSPASSSPPMNCAPPAGRRILGPSCTLSALPLTVLTLGLLSMRQVEVSRTLGVDPTPPRPRLLARPWSRTTSTSAVPTVELIFAGRRVRPGGHRSPRRSSRPGWSPAVSRSPSTPSISTAGSRECLKDGRALRIEAVVDDTYDLGCGRRLHNLPELQTRARAANHRLLDTERVGQGCVLASPASPPGNSSADGGAGARRVHRAPAPPRRPRCPRRPRRPRRISLHAHWPVPVTPAGSGKAWSRK